MKQKDRFPVSGSSALKPDCSRHSDENEHIIDFPIQMNDPFDVDHDALRQVRRTQLAARTRARISSTMLRSDTIYDLTHTSLKGTTLGIDLWHATLAGIAYVSVGLIALVLAL